MRNTLYTVQEVTEKINAGKALLLAGDEKVLAQLPKGKWIAGTIPYFMADQGGVIDSDKIFVNELPDFVTEVSLKKYDEETIKEVYNDGLENGFSVVIIPATSKVHLSFALQAPMYENFASKPLIGWISGVHLNDLGKISPAVVFGETKEVFTDKALVLHAQLPKTKYAEISIINIIEQGKGDVIMFPEDSFSAKDAIVNGQTVNFSDYVTNNELDVRLPLVADYSGAMINVSFQGNDDINKVVNFYAPVFKGVEYRQAATVDDYVTTFKTNMPSSEIADISFSCNCILNFLYGELEGKNTGGITGPITFGEIAYQLLNQTMASLYISDL